MSIVLCCSSCNELASFGGNGGTEFNDLCHNDTKISEVDINVGKVGGCSRCLTGIGTFYRYNDLGVSYT